MSARPTTLTGTTTRTMTGCGYLYVTVNVDEAGCPIEIFARLGKAGVCSHASTEAIGRLLSKALQAGADVKDLGRQLSGISCTQHHVADGERVTSCADAVGRVLAKGGGE